MTPSVPASPERRRQLQSDASRIADIYHNLGEGAAIAEFQRVCAERELVYWVQLALKDAVVNLIAPKKESARNANT